jgi:uncharacterized protein (TIGR02246 family)
MTDDRGEIRELVERYAGAADRGDGEAVAELFTEDGELVMWLDPGRPDPASHRRGQAEIAAAINKIRDYHATHHSIANSIVEISGDTAHAETRCDAHHLIGDAPNIRDHTLYIRYVDDLVVAEGRWRFARRELRVQWIAISDVETA